ncbi:MAG: zinc-dependent metalloprotease [Phaeodactylibacter sp.]|nr:zinc-dependent metalloprotease [Phaeodactylibacter sp.]
MTLTPYSLVLLLLCMLCTGAQVAAQYPFSCGFEQALDPQGLAGHAYHLSQPRGNNTIQVNTVLHVLYHDPVDNIDPASLEAIFEGCNRLFRAEDIDSSRIHPSHRAALSNTQIQFCLTQIDPEGHPTSGITRTYTDSASFPMASYNDTLWQEAIKLAAFGGVDAWDTDYYFNIWIGPIGGANQNSNTGIPRPAYPPAGALVGPGAVPGVVLDASIFVNGSLDFIAGVLAHECGHALGLLHPWGFPPTCDYDDLIEDTPLCSAGGFSCYPDTDQNTCLDSLDDQVDNYSNVMAYACQLMFTPQQADAMYTNLTDIDAGTLLIDDGACAEFPASLSNPEVAAAFDMQVYPNPNSGLFQIHFSKPLPEKAQLSLFDYTGKNLFTAAIPAGQTGLDIDLWDKSPGLYFLKMDFGEGSLFGQVLIR